MTKICLVLWLFLCSSFLFAQTKKVEQIKTPASIKIAYNSAFIYPGAKVGLELPTAIFYKTKIKKSTQKKQIKKTQFISFNLAYYHHPKYHDNLYFTAGYTFRRTNSTGFYTEFSPEIGYSRTFLGGTTYQVDEYNQVSIKRGAGYHHLLASLGAGIGYDFSTSLSKPYALFYKVNLLVLFPYNNAVHLRPKMELGIIFTPTGLFPRQIKTIIQ